MIVPQLLPVIDGLFFYLLQFLAQTLTLKGNVDFSFIDNMHIEASCASRGRLPGSPLFHIRNALHIGEPFDRLLVLHDRDARRCVVDKQLNWNLDPSFHFEIQTKLAHTNNQVLQHSHLCLGGQIDLFLVHLRVRCQRHRSQRWLAIIDRVPDFFGNEGHDGMQKAQCRVE